MFWFEKMRMRSLFVITDLIPCAILKRLGNNGKFIKVELPNAKTGFVETSIVIDEKNCLTKKGLVKLSRKFLGIPYLWRGTPAKRFDCSGFVQTVLRLLNDYLTMDTKKLANSGKEIQVKEDFWNLKVGDLLFFGKILKRITHVAISHGGGLFIHSEGCVRINSLDSSDALFNEERLKTFLMARRIL